MFCSNIYVYILYNPIKGFTVTLCLFQNIIIKFIS